MPNRTLITTRGATIVTPYTDAEAIEQLRRAGEALSSFGRSLLSQFDQRGQLSERQWPYVHQIATEDAALAQAVARAAEPVVVDLAPLTALLDRASAGLQNPRIRFRLADGELVISRAGPDSSFPGSIAVTSPGAYGAREFYGRVQTDGRWAPRRSCPAWVLEALQGLAADPAGYAGAYGRQTGNCCFCGRDLTDQRSVSVGYGPVCAGHYGLPWGDSVPEQQQAARAEAAPRLTPFQQEAAAQARRGLGPTAAEDARRNVRPSRPNIVEEQARRREQSRAMREAELTGQRSTVARIDADIERANAELLANYTPAQALPAWADHEEEIAILRNRPRTA